MARKLKSIYNSKLYIDRVPIGWVKEISFELDYENEQEATHDGKMTRNTRFPGGEITFTKLSKYEHVSEQQFLAALDNLAEFGGTVTMTSNEPKGLLIINGYGTTMDKEEWTNEANQFLEIEVTMQAAEIDREFKEHF